jgi:hypothetical protein
LILDNTTKTILFSGAPQLLYECSSKEHNNCPA